MNVTVGDLMTPQVMTTTPSKTVGHVRDVMARNNVHMLPVVGPDDEPVGAISASDLLNGAAAGTPIGKLMSEKVYTIPSYAGTHIAARMMRNHHLHRLVVTHEKKVVGLISSYDLLRLVEDHRFTMKNGPTEGKHKTGTRGKTEKPSS